MLIYFIVKLLIAAIAGFVTGRRFANLSLGKWTDALIGLGAGWLLAHILCFHPNPAASIFNEYDFMMSESMDGNLYPESGTIASNFLSAAAGGGMGVFLLGAIYRKLDKRS